MMNLAEYRRSAAQLADYLPWAALIAPGVVLNKDGSFQRTAKFRGPDLDSAVAAELVAVAGRLNNAFRRLGSGWAIFVEAQRNPSSTYPDSVFPDAASALVDAERRADFEGEADQGSSRSDDHPANGSHFVSGYFLTFLWLPPLEEAARAESWLYESRETPGVNPREMLRGFIDRTDRVLALMDGFMPECRWLDDADTLTYLHSTISTNRHRVRVPEVPMHLDALLADQPLAGGLEPRLGPAHLRVLTLTGFPTATTPGILDDLNRLAFPYRWSTRAILMDKVDATKMVTKIRRQWFAKRKSIAAILKEVMTNEQSALVDTDAANKALDADMALQELGADVAGMAWVTATITVWDHDPRLADEKLRLIEKVIQGRDFTAMSESVNAVDAWLGSLPGHAYANVRQPPISTLNLAHMIPLSAVWAGPERDEHLGGPPLLYGRTEGSTPFRFSLHVGDVGHTLVVGPTGAGKSVLLALMALQFRRYAGSQIFAFDFGGSIRASALAMGGDWHDLGGALTEGDETTVALQPLARIHESAERAWAADWIAAILARESIAITPEVREYLWTALTSLASAPVGERTITGLSVLLQSNDLKQALRPYCIGGAYGRLLDAEAEHLGSASVQAFEIEGLVGTGAAPAVLSYLFHRIGDRLDGRPTLLIIDEGWLALDDEGFAGQLREWLKTLRKKNASVIFATQSLSDIDNSAIAPAIIESCPTRLLLPNERAIEPQITAIYRRFGLNDRQIEILARATPKRDYYCQSRRGNRLFELGLSEVGLALCAASSKTDQALITEILAEHGRVGFLAAWLRARGVEWAAELIPNLTNLVPEAAETAEAVPGEVDGGGADIIGAPEVPVDLPDVASGDGPARDAPSNPSSSDLTDPDDEFALYDTFSEQEIEP
ncbi:conjugal transfer protein TrbE [Paracoccus pantotrophus]|uniref:conjugal transfer protein TrbE n=1 Tax=Paracoccus pantotrophus TaxID=82367 RepID=UPI001C54D7AE|nr:conjugal transfer protein TrbE [Paracoccus pantotrophus]